MINHQGKSINDFYKTDPEYTIRMVKYELDNIDKSSPHYKRNETVLQHALDSLNALESTRVARNSVSPQAESVMQIIGKDSAKSESVVKMLMTKKKVPLAEQQKILASLRYMNALQQGQADKSQSHLGELSIKQENLIRGGNVVFGKWNTDKEIPSTTIMPPDHLNPYSKNYDSNKRHDSLPSMTLADLKQQKKELEEIRMKLHNDQYLENDADNDDESLRDMRFDVEKTEKLLQTNKRILELSKRIDDVTHSSKGEMLSGDKDALMKEATLQLTSLYNKKRELISASSKDISDKDKRRLLQENTESIAKIETMMQNKKKQQERLKQFGFTLDLDEKIRQAKNKPTLLELIAYRSRLRKEGKLVEGMTPSLDVDKNLGIQAIDKQARGVYGFKSCSKCHGFGKTDDNRVCRTCQGSGSAKYADYGKPNMKPTYICKSCNNKGFADPNCPNCHGNTIITNKSERLAKAGATALDIEDSVTPFNRMLRKNEQKRWKSIDPPEKRGLARKPYKGSDGNLYVGWIDKKTMRPKKGIDPITGYPYGHV